MSDQPVLSLRLELRDTLKLAAPIVLNQVGHMSMGMVDTLISGRISTTALAGLGLAANFFWTFTSVCVGCLLALDTYFAQSVGARDEEGLSRYLGQSLWSALLVTLVSTAAVAMGAEIYLFYATPGETTGAVRTYIGRIIWCTPSIFFYFVLQRYWQARHQVVAFTLIIIGANILNLVACIAFGLGAWGFPRMEVKGIATATVISRYAMLLTAAIFTVWKLRPASLRPAAFDWAIQRSFLKLGLPAASHTALEIGAFTIATFVVGALGAVPLAAHHVCLMMAAFTFMFPYGFGSAAAVRVGMFVGAGRADRARLAGWLCIAISVTVMTVFALGYLVMPRFLLHCFTSDPNVVDLGVKILMLVALFQIADGIQVSTTGALRGLGNTRSPMIANLMGHYPIGLALGLVLCFGFGFGAVGLWCGLAAGLISVAAMLVRTWSTMTRDTSCIRPLAAASGSNR